MNYRMKKGFIYPFIAFLVMTYVLVSQAYAIFVIHKPFWLDEWYIISNIKFHSYSNIFSSLSYAQEFPRIYLTIIKFFSGMFNFSEPSIRIIPCIMGILAVVFSYYLSRKIIYKTDAKSALLFFLLLLCNATMHNYFIQLKQYTADILFSLLAIWQYGQYCENFNRKNTEMMYCSRNYFFSLLIFFIAPFFSYTYPIVAAPVIFSLGLTWLFTEKNSNSFKTLLLPIMIFLVAILIAYLIDIRMVLSDQQMKVYWHEYFVDYTNITQFFLYLLNSWHYFFGDVIYSSPYARAPIHSFSDVVNAAIPWVFCFITLFGAIVTFKKIPLKKINSFFIFSEGAVIESYFFMLLLLIIILYLSKMLPIEGGRLNFFSDPMIIFFFLAAVSWLDHHFGFRISSFWIVSSITVITSIVLVIFFYSSGFSKHSKWYDADQYSNMGSAIRTAQSLNLPLAISYGAAPYRWTLAVETHPAYDVKKMLPHYSAMSDKLVDIGPTLCDLKDIPNDKKFVVILRYRYEIQTYASICGEQGVGRQ